MILISKASTVSFLTSCCFHVFWAPIIGSEAAKSSVAMFITFTQTVRKYKGEWSTPWFCYTAGHISSCSMPCLILKNIIIIKKTHPYCKTMLCSFHGQVHYQIQFPGRCREHLFSCWAESNNNNSQNAHLKSKGYEKCVCHHKLFTEWHTQISG